MESETDYTATFERMFTSVKEMSNNRNLDVFLRVSVLDQEVSIECVGSKPGEYFAGCGTMYNGESWQEAAVDALGQILTDFSENGACQIEDGGINLQDSSDLPGLT
jgi:hypothetical protein